MKLNRRFAEMTPEKTSADPHMDGTALRFETMEHGGEYPDTMPQAIKLIDAEGLSGQKAAADCQGQRRLDRCCTRKQPS